MRNVIVLCTGNICRSPMAQALLSQRALELAPERPVNVTSAGLGALVAHSADSHALRLMAGRGIDIEQHRARAFTGAMGLENDLILTMSMTQRHRVESRWPLLQGRTFTLGHFDDQEVEDPYRKGESAFREALIDIEKGVAHWAPIVVR